MPERATKSGTTKSARGKGKASSARTVKAPKTLVLPFSYPSDLRVAYADSSLVRVDANRQMVITLFTEEMVVESQLGELVSQEGNVGTYQTNKLNERAGRAVQAVCRMPAPSAVAMAQLILEKAVKELGYQPEPQEEK